MQSTSPTVVNLGVGMWGTHESATKEDLTSLLRSLRAQDGVTLQLPRHRHAKRIFALLGAADLDETITLLRQATQSSPGDKYLHAAANALNLTGQSSTLTQRRNTLIEQLVQLDPAAPRTPPGIADWEDIGFGKMAVHLLKGMPSSDLNVAVGKLNKRIFALEAGLQKQIHVSEYRDEKIRSAIHEVTSVIFLLLEKDDSASAADRMALRKLMSLRQLLLGPSEAIRPLDLSGHPSAGLFIESHATQMHPTLSPSDLALGNTTADGTALN